MAAFTRAPSVAWGGRGCKGPDFGHYFTILLFRPVDSLISYLNVGLLEWVQIAKEGKRAKSIITSHCLRCLLGKELKHWYKYKIKKTLLTWCQFYRTSKRSKRYTLTWGYRKKNFVWVCLTVIATPNARVKFYEVSLTGFGENLGRVRLWVKSIKHLKMVVILNIRKWYVERLTIFENRITSNKPGNKLPNFIVLSFFYIAYL